MTRSVEDWDWDVHHAGHAALTYSRAEVEDCPDGQVEGSKAEGRAVADLCEAEHGHAVHEVAGPHEERVTHARKQQARQDAPREHVSASTRLGYTPTRVCQDHGSL